jgi:hypothetical protein
VDGSVLLEAIPADELDALREQSSAYARSLGAATDVMLNLAAVHHQIRRMHTYVSALALHKRCVECGREWPCATYRLAADAVGAVG